MGYNLKTFLSLADEEGFAIPAFNCSDAWSLRGIVEAARLERAPVIAQVIPSVIHYWSLPSLGQVAVQLSQESEAALFLHLDHSIDPVLCNQAIDAGFPSVMIDGSPLTPEENVSKCRIVADYASTHNVCVEAEVGRIRGKNSEGAYLGNDFLASVEDAVYIASHSGADSLAVGIGNAHGFYAERPQLSFQRLQEIHEAVNIPLVLHGGSGIPDEDIQRAIQGGISKVNVGTQINHSYLTAIKENLGENNPRTNILTSMQPAVDAVREEARRWIRLCGASGKAAL